MNRVFLSVAEWIASVFRIGYLPLAPGTWGSAAALLTWFFLPQMTITIFVLIVINIFLVGVIASSIVAIRDNQKDPPKVVIDEWVGMWIALIGIPKHWGWMVLSFVLFRFFDVVKPPPIRRLETRGMGWGIMLDDVLAGVYALISFHVIYFLL